MAVSKTDVRDWLKSDLRHVIRILGLQDFPVDKVSIAFDGTDGGLGTDDYGVIHIDPKFLEGRTAINVEGALAHEIAHAVVTIDNPDNNPATTKAVESIASAVRFRMFGDEGWDIPPDAMTRKLGTMDPWALRVVQRTLMAGKPAAPVIKDIESGTITKADYVAATTDPTAATNQSDYALTGQGHAGTNPLANVSGGGGNGNDENPYDGGPGDGNGSRGEDKARRQTKATFRETVLSFGMPITDEINQLIAQAFQHDWTGDQFMQSLRGTATYKDRFPGIFNQDGSMKMTENDYLYAEKAYQSAASHAGINMGPKRMAYLFKNDVTPDEFMDRATAFSRLNTNKDLYASFKRELVQAGVAKPSEVNTNKEMFKFVMGEGNKKWADLWQDTVTRNAANQAGLVINKNKDRYTSIGQKALEHISSLGLSEAEMAQKFVALADTMAAVLPLEEAQLYGIGRKTAVTAAFGGKNAEAAKQKIERALNTDEAFYADRAQSAVYSDEQGGLITQGVTDRSKQQQSAY